MTIFSDGADSIASAGNALNGPGINAPFSPSIKPNQTLASFNGQNKQGWWKLKCADGVGLDFGYVSVWGLQISSVPIIKTLKLTALIQGFYDNSQNKMVQDTAVIYLKDVNSPYNNLDTAKHILDSTGKGNFSYFNITNGVPFFIVAKHRNSIETWSSAGYSFSSDTLYYDFTLAASQAYQSNQIQVDTSPVEFAIYNADVNLDEIVDAQDIIFIYNDIDTTGYVTTDVTGDDYVDVSDLVLAYNNANNVVSVIRP